MCQLLIDFSIISTSCNLYSAVACVMESEVVNSFTVESVIGASLRDPHTSGSAV